MGKKSKISSHVTKSQLAVHRHKVIKNEKGLPMATPKLESGPYVPKQIRHAYGLDTVTADGTGQIIAIIDAYACPTAVADFQKYDKEFGINKPNNLIVKSFTNKSNPGWALETLLDIQWAHAIAPGATILLVQAASDSLYDLLVAVDYANNYRQPVTNNKVSVVSLSWGSNEFNTQGNYNYFKTNGIVYVASSGDVGGVVIWPSACPNILSIGGTSLNLDSNGNKITAETGWSGSGGGSSRYENLPNYQKSFGLNGKRQTPDVSLIADPNPGVAVYNSFGYNGSKGWFRVGGTSLSAPCWAGLIALANQLRVGKGKAVLSNISIQNHLYNILGKGLNYPKDYTDITSGNTRYVSKIGYDNVTGLGTSKNNLILDLVNLVP